MLTFVANQICKLLYKSQLEAETQALQKPGSEYGSGELLFMNLWCSTAREIEIVVVGFDEKEVAKLVELPF